MDIHDSSHISATETLPESWTLLQVSSFTVFMIVLAWYLKYIWGVTTTQLKSSDTTSFGSGLKYFVPFLGNALFLCPLKYAFYTVLHSVQKYGPILKAKDGNTVVLLNSTSLAKSLLNSSLFSKIPSTYKPVEDFYPNVVLVAKEQSWKVKGSDLLEDLLIENYMPTINKHCARLVTQIEKIFLDGKPHTIKTTISIGVLDVITELVTGVDFHGTVESEKNLRLLKTAETITVAKIFDTWLQKDFIWKFHPLMKKQEEIIAHANKFTKDVINRRVSQRNESEKSESALNNDKNGSSKCFVDELLDAGLDKKQTSEEILIMILAGHDISNTVLHLFCFAMALQPEHQLKCRQEIESILAKETYVTWDHVEKMQYLNWCFDETVRVFSEFPGFGRPLDNLLATDKKGHSIGTSVIMCPWTMQNVFEISNQFCHQSFSRPEFYNRSAFGFTAPTPTPKRNCLGLPFGTVDLRVAATYILRNFDIKSNDKIDEILFQPNQKLKLKLDRDYEFTFKKLF